MLSMLYSYLDRIYNKDFFLIRYRFLKIFINAFAPIYYKLVKRNKLDPKSNIIISLTTFPERIHRVHLVIESLLHQKKMPKQIILYLSKLQFEDFEVIPNKLKKMHQFGYLTIKFVDEDYKSHKKYYYVIKDYAQYDIVTVDDDIFYPEDFLQALFYTHIQHPNAVCCFWADKIVVHNNRICSYDKWTFDVQCDKEMFNLLPIGCAGIYYPSGCFLLPQLLNASLFMSLCPKADDIWLRCNTMMNNVNVVKSGYYKNFIFIDIMIKNNVRLCDENVDGKKNDVQFQKMIALFPEIERNIIEKRE